MFASEAHIRASLEVEFTRAVTIPGPCTLGQRKWEVLFARFARYYEQLTRLPRRTRRALQRQCRRSLAAIALLLALGQAPALAATINVGGTCTLVRAITAANTDTATGGCTAGSGADTLVLQNSSVHTLTSVDNSTYGDIGLPVVSSVITIEGNGSTIRRDPADPDLFRIFAVNGTGDLTLNETTVSGGVAVDGDGGGGASAFPPGTDAKLGPLADNGGPTQTHALIAGSPAIDAVGRRCPPPATDQRGVPRPQGAACDIGSFEIMAAPAPDLAVSKTDSPDPVLVSDHLRYTMTVNNAGQGEATGVILTDTLPASVDFVSVRPRDVCGELGGVVTCELGTLASGEKASVTIVVKPTTTGRITNRVKVASAETDENPENNTDRERTTVNKLLCNGRVPTLVGTPGNNTLTGTSGRDTCNGGSGTATGTHCETVSSIP